MEQKNNGLRGTLLEWLNKLYPDGADLRLLVGTLYQYHKPDDIKVSLEYLADKGYISKKELPHPYKAGELIVIYKITPAGIDLMDGTTSDPGIAMPRG
jgi:hypothetical protein